MLLEEEVEEYVKERQVFLIKNVTTILLCTFSALSLFYLCRYICFRTQTSLMVLFYYLVLSVLFFYVRHICKKNAVKTSATVLSLVFFSLSLIVLLKMEGSITLSFLSFLVAFVILLVTNNEKFSLVLLVAYLLGFFFIKNISINSLTLVPSYISSQVQILYEFKTYWLFLFLLYVLYECCIMKKTCNRYRAVCIGEYRKLANLEYKHRLMGKISKCLIHDISTPLSVLSGSLGLLENSQLKDSDISVVKNSALNSLLYLENILENSSLLLKDVEKKSEFNPDVILKRVLLIVKSRAQESNIVLTSNLSSKDVIYGNESFFARAVLNVLINAVEELEVDEGNTISKRIEIMSKVKNSHYIIKIKDSGRGIQKDVLRSIRGGVVSTKNNNHLGLGLYFVLDTVEKHFKGSLIISSRKGKSTTVIFKIPTC